MLIECTRTHAGCDVIATAETDDEVRQFVQESIALGKQGMYPMSVQISIPIADWLAAALSSPSD